MRNSMKRFSQAVTPILLAVGSLGAQGTDASAAGGRAAPICWLRPGPLERCRSFLVTEAAFEVPIATTRRSLTPAQTQKDFATRFTLSLGLMKNVTAGQGVGVVLGHDVNRDLFRG